MKNKEAIETVILEAAKLVKQDRLDEVLLMVAKSNLNAEGQLYELFCDNQGTKCSYEEYCSDAVMLYCIRRFLEREVPEDK